jgi:hypothetical protein
LLIVGSITAYQQVLLLAPARHGITVTTTTTVTSFVAATNTSASTVTITSSTTTVGNQAIASSINYTMGLEITLTLNATRITQGEAIDATLTSRDVLPRALNLSSFTEDWRLTSLASDGDDFGYCTGASPFAIEVFNAHFTASNVSLGAPLNADLKDALIGCDLPVAPYRIFQPLANETQLSDVTNGYNVNGQESPFPPATLTVVAGDRWGQMVMLSFVVEESAS